MAKQKKPNANLKEWIDARKRHRLSHAQLQMARELGMTPKSLRKLDGNQDQLWKDPLPQYLEYLYAKRFGREQPEVVMSIEEKVKRDEAKKAAKRAAKALRQAAAEPPAAG